MAIKKDKLYMYALIFVDNSMLLKKTHVKISILLYLSFEWTIEKQKVRTIGIIIGLDFHHSDSLFSVDARSTCGRCSRKPIPWWGWHQDHLETLIELRNVIIQNQQIQNLEKPKGGHIMYLSVK